MPILTPQDIQEASRVQLQEWEQLVFDVNEIRTVTDLKRRDRTIALGLMRFEIDIDGYYLSATDLYVQIADRLKDLEEPICQGCGGNETECECGSQPEYTADDIDYFAAIYSSPY
jgi:hypothetical protein